MQKSLVSLLMAAGVASAAVNDTLEIDIVVRDFPSTHPDFETFEVQNPNTTCQRFGYATRGTPNQMINKDLVPTLGLVQPTLNLLDPNDPLSGKPVPATNGDCATSDLANWFKDVATAGRPVPYKVETTLKLARDPSDLTGRTYVLDATYGTDKAQSNDAAISTARPTYGFFPLDKYNDSAANLKGYGKQNLIGWCGAAFDGSGYALPTWTQTSCQIVGKAFGKTQGLFDPVKSTLNKNATPVANYASNPKIWLNNAVIGNQFPSSFTHNSHFTVEGSAIIRYYGTGLSGGPKEYFEFYGDDDLWVFIDNKLVTDLGGLHAAKTIGASSADSDPNDAWIKLDMDQLAIKNQWPPNSEHTLKFFQVDRQTDASNLYMRMTLVKPLSRNSALEVRDGKACGEGQENSAEVYLNSDVYPADLSNLANIKNSFVLKYTTGVTVPFTPTSLTPIPYDASTPLSERAKGVKYKLGFPAGVVQPVPGDSLAVNDSAQVGAAYTSLRNAIGRVTSTKVFTAFGAGTAGACKATDPTIKVIEKKAESLVFEKLTEVQNVAKNDPSNANKTGGEVIFTTSNFSKDGKVDSLGNIYNGTLTDRQTVLGSDLSNPTTIKSGVGTPTRCKRDANDPSLTNCLTVPPIIVRGPFKANINVYDHLGQFIRRQTLEVPIEQIHQMQELGGVKTLPNGTKYYANTGLIANVALYPVDQNGRQISSGVYIVQMDVVEGAASYLKWSDELGTSTQAVNVVPNRTYQTFKVPYARPNGSK